MFTNGTDVLTNMQTVKVESAERGDDSVGNPTTKSNSQRGIGKIAMRKISDIFNANQTDTKFGISKVEPPEGVDDSVGLLHH